MKQQRGSAPAKYPQPAWPQILRAHFNRHGIVTAPPDPRTALRLLHDIRAEQSAQAEHRCDAACADVIASQAGYGIRAARWIMQSLKRDEVTMFLSALRPLRASCDRHGRLRTPVGAGEACTALDVLRYYASANGMTPAAALRRLFTDQESVAPLDDAAAHALYFALRRAASGETSGTSACEQAAVADWTPAIEAAFDKRGQPRIHLPRRTAMSMLARIAREANRACVKWGFDEPGAHVDAEFGLLRRACMLVHARTHVISPVHAMLIIAALKTRSKSALLFASLTPLV